MKKEEKPILNNDLGIVGVVFGILSIIFALFQPISGFIIAIIGLVFSFKQNKVMRNKWSKAGIILGAIGIILSIIIVIVAFNFISSIANNPELLAQLQNVG